MQEHSYFKISGLSMWPSCRPGDKLLIAKVSPQELKIGDIIAYKSQGALICHRLVMKTGRNGNIRMRARGDCSFSLGEIVDAKQFFGKATAILRGDRIISLVGLRSQMINLLLAVISPLFLLRFKLNRRLKIPISEAKR
ncbi:S24/S26 family peptidase [Candidatus Omnitrophota bacterium]